MSDVVVETRWIILSADGRHITVGRHSDPSPEELTQAEARLAAQGLAGWLAVMKGGYYDRSEPSVMMVRPLCSPKVSFTEAVASFLAIRKLATR